MSAGIIDYQKLIDYIKANSPCITASVHKYLSSNYNLSPQSRSNAITKLVKLKYIERDKDFPNSVIKYIRV